MSDEEDLAEAERLLREAVLLLDAERVRATEFEEYLGHREHELALDELAYVARDTPDARVWFLLRSAAEALLLDDETDEEYGSLVQELRRRAP